MSDETQYQLTHKGQVYAAIKSHCPAATIENIEALMADPDFWSAIVSFLIDSDLIFASGVNLKYFSRET